MPSQPGFLRLAAAVVLPNAGMQYNSTGITSEPDGYVRSTQYDTDVGAGKVVQRWEGLQLSLSLTDAPPFGDDRCLHISLKDSATSDATRYLSSPPATAGALWGAEQMVAGDYWRYTLCFWWHGEALSAPVTGDFRVELLAKDASSGRIKTVVGYDLPAASFDLQAWTTLKRWIYYQSPSGLLDTSSWSGAGTTNPTQMYINLIAKHNSVVSAGNFLSACFARLGAYTLGPLETPGATLNRLGYGDNYWELSRPIQLQGSDPAEYEHYAMLSRAAGGQGRLSDPSGGIQKRHWKVHFVNATETDREMLYRASRYNHGYPTAPGSALGHPAPLALIWDQAEDQDAGGVPAMHVVDMEGPFIAGYDRARGWVPAARADVRYDLTCVFREI